MAKHKKSVTHPEMSIIQIIKYKALSRTKPRFNVMSVVLLNSLNIFPHVFIDSTLDPLNKVAWNLWLTEHNVNLVKVPHTSIPFEIR